MSPSSPRRAGPVRWFLENYASRHQHPVNRALHVVGLPVTFALPVWFLADAKPIWATACFVSGYLLQFLGHAVEGNDAGEVVLVKKALGWPYVAIVERPKPAKKVPALGSGSSEESKFAG